jgi:hypothetical protein
MVPNIAYLLEGILHSFVSLVPAIENRNERNKNDEYNSRYKSWKYLSPNHVQ